MIPGAMSQKALRQAKGYYIFEKFLKYGCLAAFSRARLNLGFRNNPGLKINRKAFLKSLNISHQDLVCLKQVHGSQVFLASGENRGRGALAYSSAITGYDALITAERKLPLAVFTADCLSIFLYDIRKKIAAIIHAGWRGTKENIVLAAIELMSGNFSSRAQDILCGLGPGIRTCCYEVGPEFKDYFPKGLIRRKGSLFLDLAGLNYVQLISKGLLKEKIIDSGICTCCENKDFFSYRREGKFCGRMMSVIMIN